MTQAKRLLNIVESLQNLKVGDMLVAPAEQANNVRSTASNYGFQWGRKFKTKQNREDRTLTVIRLS